MTISLDCKDYFGTGLRLAQMCVCMMQGHSSLVGHESFGASKKSEAKRILKNVFIDHWCLFSAISSSSRGKICCRCIESNSVRRQRVPAVTSLRGSLLLAKGNIQIFVHMHPSTRCKV